MVLPEFSSCSTPPPSPPGSYAYDSNYQTHTQPMSANICRNSSTNLHTPPISVWLGWLIKSLNAVNEMKSLYFATVAFYRLMSSLKCHSTEKATNAIVAQRMTKSTHEYVKGKKVKESIAVNGTPSHRYGVSPAVWDHTVLPATRHRRTHPAFSPSPQPDRLVLDLPTI